MEWIRTVHRRLLPQEPSIGWTPYLWLVYLSFFFFKYQFVSPGGLEVLALIVTIIVFLALYFNGYWRSGWALAPNIIGIALIGTVWSPVNIGASVFFIYAGAFVGWFGPPGRAVAALAIIIAWAAIVTFVWQSHPFFWGPATVITALVGLVNIYYAGVTRRDAATRLSQEEVRQLAQVAERERISRDLHDLLGHTLSVITLKSELAGRLLERDPARARTEIAEVEQVSRAALAQVREAITGMRTRGLAGELELARVALKAAAVELVVEGEIPELPPREEAVLAMVLRESVTNVIRHAGASHCRVSFTDVPDGLTIDVRDDGRGGPYLPGGGLEGMRARLADAGGRLEVVSEYGTRVRAWVPT